MIKSGFFSVLLMLVMFTQQVALAADVEVPWFTGIADDAEKKRREIFDEQFDHIAPILKKLNDKAGALEANAERMKGISAMPSDARYHYCQQWLYACLLKQFKPGFKLEISDKPYPDWSAGLIAAHKEVFGPQVLSLKKRLQKDNWEIVERSATVEDIEHIAQVFPRDDLSFVLLTLPKDLNLWTCGRYREVVLRAGTKESSSPNIAKGGPPAKTRADSDETELPRMDAETAGQVQEMVACLKKLDKLERGQDEAGMRQELLRCEALVEPWQDNPLLASYYQWLARYWRKVYLWGEEQDPQVRQRCMDLYERTMRLYGDECVSTERIAMITNFSDNLNDYINEYRKVWGFYSGGKKRVYPIRDITSYYDLEIGDYPPAHMSAEELERESKFLESDRVHLDILGDNIVMRLGRTGKLELPEDLRGSPLWQKVMGKDLPPGPKPDPVPDSFPRATDETSAPAEPPAHQARARGDEAAPTKPPEKGEPRKGSWLVWSGVVAAGAIALAIILLWRKGATGG